MYVIYINDRPLTLRAENEPGTRGPAPRHLTARYNGKARTLLNYADMLEKGSPKVTSVDLVGPDPERLWQDFRSHYKWIPAAGGLVRNPDLDRHLFIFRRGAWDLPKGKIDAGETPAAAALREVREETGLGDLGLGRALPTTYHTYRTGKGKRVLKPTYWFGMESRDRDLVPQAEEDITEARWRAIPEVIAEPSLYANLRAFLRALPGA